MSSFPGDGDYRVRALIYHFVFYFSPQIYLFSLNNAVIIYEMLSYSNVEPPQWANSGSKFLLNRSRFSAEKDMFPKLDLEVKFFNGVSTKLSSFYKFLNLDVSKVVTVGNPELLFL